MPCDQGDTLGIVNLDVHMYVKFVKKKILIV